jgi:hypothetical protein
MTGKKYKPIGEEEPGLRYSLKSTKSEFRNRVISNKSKIQMLIDILAWHYIFPKTFDYLSISGRNKLPGTCPAVP